jgi:hypothetical protein
MKLKQKPQTTFDVELTLEEVEYIRGLTQNGTDNESLEQANLRRGLFVGCMRILGYNINDDGSMVRTNKIMDEVF